MTVLLTGCSSTMPAAVGPDPDTETTPVPARSESAAPTPGDAASPAERAVGQPNTSRSGPVIDPRASDAPLPDGTVTVQEAADWLTYPILGFESRVRVEGGREFAEYATRSPSPDPRNGAIVHVVWQPRALDYSFDDETDRRGVHLQLRVIAPHNVAEGAQREPHPMVRHTYKSIVVRGHDALMSEGYKDDREREKRGNEPWMRGSNVNERRIRWTTDLDDERWAEWIVMLDPLQYTEQESIAVIEAMDEIEPR